MALQSEADLTTALTYLKSVDALLRCPICFDFVSIAMMTKCSHNFCSLCIRKYLSYKLQCPVCNSSMMEQDLRNNRILDDLIISYQSARKELSKGGFDMPPLSTPTPASTPASTPTPASSPTPASTPTPRTPGGPTRDGSILSHFLQKVPKDSPLSAAAAATPPPSSCRSEQAPGAQAPGRADAHSTNASPGVAVKKELLEKKAGGEGRKDTEISSSSVTPPPPPTTSCLAAEQDGMLLIKVECPVCSVGVTQKFINKHLDTCLTSDDKKESLRGSNAGGRRPMCKLVYNLLSLQGLKKRLRACHLSTHGPRDLLVRRHQDFVHAYNAECDSLSPKSAEEIAKELEANEKTRTRLQGRAKPVLVFPRNRSKAEIDEVHSNYTEQKHDSVTPFWKGGGPRGVAQQNSIHCVGDNKLAGVNLGKKHSTTFSRLVSQVKGRLKNRVKQEVVTEGAVAGGSRLTAAGSKASTVDAGEGLPGPSLLQTKTREPPTAAAADAAPVSPAGSDVSISSSVSGIFDDEPSGDVLRSETTTPGRKRRAASRDEDTSSPPLASGKRRRKTRGQIPTVQTETETERDGDGDRAAYGHPDSWMSQSL